MTLPYQFRRAAAVLCSAFIGAAAAAAFAAPANAHTADLTADAACTDTGWNAHWTLTATATGGRQGIISDAKVELTYKVVPPGGGGGQGAGPTVPGLTNGTKITGDSSTEGTLALPGVATGASLTLTVTWTVGADVHTKTVQARAEAPADCGWPPPVQPSELTWVSDCTSLIITLANPENGRDEVSVRLKPSNGEQRILAAAAGETNNEEFEGVPGLTVAITDNNIPNPPDDPKVVAYKRPAGCGDGTTPAGTAGEGGAGGGTLPVTGAAAGTAIGAAVVLLTVGGALFFMARRRRTRFTA